MIADYQPGVSTSHGVLNWQVSAVTDPSGNKVSYEWAADPGQIPTIRDVKYSDVDIHFDSEQRPDPFTTAGGDGILTKNSRLARITVTAGGATLRSYALTYGAHAQASRQSFLESVQEFGSDGTTSLPATTYNTAASGTTSSWQQAPDVAQSDYSTNWPAGPDDSTQFNRVLTDLPIGPVPWANSSSDRVSWMSLDTTAPTTHRIHKSSLTRYREP